MPRPESLTTLEQIRAWRDPWRVAARTLHAVPGTVEVDENAGVSMAGETGAWVQAWVWVPGGEVTA